MFKKILIFCRPNEKNVKKFLSHLRKKSKIVNVVWSVNPEDKLKSRKFLNQNYDYIISFRNFYILKKKLLNKAKYAAINFHPSPPKYRGMGCLNFALYNNEKNYGTTVHLMSTKIDYGKIIDVQRFKLLKRFGVETLLEKTHKQMLRQAIKIVNLLSKDHTNLNKLIQKSKNEKWTKKITTREDLDQLYNINKNISHASLLKTIKACYIHNSFRPYLMHRKYKFVLINPYYEKTSKNQKYKMYFNLPSDLKKK